jgi:predicted kinase
MKIDETKLLVVMVGLPRSGKSTWARKKGWPIVNRDSIRLAIHGERFLKPTEELVQVAALYMVRCLFLAGHDIVIVDETCTTRKRRDYWRVDRPWTTVFKHIETSAEECRERALIEKDYDIMPVIERMDDQFEPLDTDECLMSDPPSILGIDLASEPDQSVEVTVEKQGDQFIIGDPRFGEPGEQEA